MNTANLTWILQLATTIAMGIIAFWLKDWKTKTESQLIKNESDIKCVEKSLNDLKTQMPYNYTLREDFIRGMANLEKQLDKMDTNFDTKFDRIGSNMEQKLDDIFKTVNQKIDRMEEHLNKHIVKKEV
jgi:DNA anti-recombination protein RmuC